MPGHAGSLPCPRAVCGASAPRPWLRSGCSANLVRPCSGRQSLATLEGCQLRERRGPEERSLHYLLCEQRLQQRHERRRQPCTSPSEHKASCVKAQQRVLSAPAFACGGRTFRIHCYAAAATEQEAVALPGVRITQEELPESKVRLRIEVPAQEVRKAYDRALKEARRYTTVPGFRKGKRVRYMPQVET